ncbi:MAG: metal-dependent hydrolase [Nanoarchaeota archaeon]
MKAKFLGHAAFQFDDLVVDPFITGNENIKDKISLEEIKCSVVCITHDHSDHIGDAFEIAKKNNATIVACAEIAFDAQGKGLNAEPMNIGGTINVGDWTIKMVSATHSCNSGTPTGFILTKGGRTLYHAGDTGLFEDMKRLAEENIEFALLPIGDRFTMGTKDAGRAAEFVGAQKVIPIHYNTWPPIEANPEELKQHTSKEIVIFEPLEEKEI